MKLLAIDCSTQACSVALLNDESTGKNEIVERYNLAVKTHTERLLPMVDEVLADTQYSLKQMDAIAFGCGPGSFTGLRICLGVVQGLAYGANLPVVPISSLNALAQTVLTMKVHPTDNMLQILSTIDARMDQIYWGVYRNVDGLAVLEGREHLTAPEQLVLPSSESYNCGRVIAVGTGFQYQERIACSTQVTVVDETLLPHATAVAYLACEAVKNEMLLSPEQAQATYLRDQVAWKKQ